jgi:hypothetical protein
VSDSQPSAKRRNLPFVLGLVAIALSLPIAWKVFLSDSGPTVAPVVPVALAAVPDAGTKKVELKLTQVTGKVQIKRANGEWADAKNGDAVNSSDGVRTADGSYAVVVGGEYWEVKMEPGTEVEIGELSDSISKLLLESGMARATVKGSGRHTFEVRANKSDAVARTDGGVFSIASNGNGTVAVGTQEGAVEFLGKGRVVIVRAGQQSIVRPGQAPSEPVSIPSSLLLKVGLPARSVVNRSKLVVVGTAEPGARIEIGGKMVKADEKGRFETTLKLKEGKNAIEVSGHSVGALEAKSTHQIELDTTVRKTTIDKNLWGTQKK